MGHLPEDLPGLPGSTLTPTPWLAVWVQGQPIPQGSKSLTYRTTQQGQTTARMYDANPRLRAWRKQLTAGICEAMAQTAWATLEGVPIRVGLTFTLPTPQATAAIIKRQPGRHPAWRGYDLDKLARAALDSLTDARAWDDDSRVTTLIARKLWAGSTGATPQPGLYLEVREDKT